MNNPLSPHPALIWSSPGPLMIDMGRRLSNSRHICLKHLLSGIDWLRQMRCLCAQRTHLGRLSNLRRACP